MPTAAPSACSEPLCPHPAVDRGRCDLHQRTTSERGYGTEHQREAAAARPGAKCEACGCTRNLERDHRIPTSLGGSQASVNKRWLCRCPEHGCHDRLGVRSDRLGVPRETNRELTVHEKARWGHLGGPPQPVATPPPYRGPIRA